MSHQNDSKTQATMPKQTAYLIAVLCLLLGFMTGAMTAGYFLPGQKAQPAQQQPAQNEQQATGMNAAEQRRQLDLEMETQRHPENRDAWVALGHIYFDSGNHVEAIHAYTHALDLDPKDANIWTDLGVMYRRNGQPKEAIKSFDKAIAIDPRHQTARFNKGVVMLHDLNDKAGAIASWQELLKVNPDAKSPSGQPIRLMIDEM